MDIERLKLRLALKAKAEYQQAKAAWHSAKEAYDERKRMIRNLAPSMVELILKEVPSDLNGTGSTATPPQPEMPKIPQYKMVSNFIEKQPGQFTIPQIINALKNEAPGMTEKFVGNVLFKLKKDGSVNMDKRGGRFGASIYSRRNGKTAVH